MKPTAKDDLADHLTCVSLATRVILNPRTSIEQQARAFAILIRSADDAQRCREQLITRN